MNFFRKIIYLAVLIAAARALSMQPGEQQQQSIELNNTPEQSFFSYTPTLKQAAQLYIIKQMLINPNLIQSFTKANLPQELRGLGLLARLVVCLLNLLQDDEWQDVNLLNEVFTREVVDNLKEDKKPAMIQFVNCVRNYAVPVFSNKELTNLWILLLNDVSFHARFPAGKDQVLELFESTYAQLLSKNKINILYSLFTTYPQLRKSILEFLNKLLTKPADELSEYVNRHVLPVQPIESNINVEYAAQDDDGEAEVQYKNSLFKDMHIFFKSLTADEILHNSTIVENLVEELYQSPEVIAAGQLLELLAQKGANLNASEVVGYSVPIYIFGVRGPELFGNVPEDLKKPYQDFLINLIRNGLDITELQNVQQPIDINAPVAEIQTPLQFAQRNYEIAIQNDPAFKVAIENAQREYVQNKIKQESRAKN